MFKLITWNVNSINVRLERLLQLLERSQPDVVCLQELKCPEEKFPFEAIGNLGYDSYVYGQKTYNGVALLSKTKLQNVQKGFCDGKPEDPHSRLIRATFKDTQIYCGYFPNGQEVGSEKYAYKLSWFERLYGVLSHHDFKREKLILAGDFNVAPEDSDVHDPNLWRGKILCSAQERDALAKLMKLGFVDTFRLHHKEAGLFSWWDYRMLGFQKNEGLRIDLILASLPLSTKCSSSSIDREERKGEKPSDHAPVISEFSES